jgi:prepilin-type processing-associated H-X9-DG protein
MSIEDNKLTHRGPGSQRWTPPQWMEWLVVLGIGGVLSVFFMPRGAGRGDWPNCRNNLRQIVLALEAYHDTYGCYPPAYVTDNTGRPVHSWRVLILPYMEARDLYHQYRMDEPWDSPQNGQLAGRIKDLYRCSYDHDHKRSTETSFVAVIGPNTLWRGEKSTRQSDIKDGVENVIAVVEVHNSGIHWMEPRDLHVQQMAPTINAPHGQGISSAHGDSANVAFADGMVRRLPQWTAADTLRSWLNIDDGTLVEPPQ